MQVIADLQLHSKYARAVSPQMVIPEIARWAARKGIGLVATGDWTHPLWFREIQLHLEEVGNGLLKLKSKTSPSSSHLAQGEERGGAIDQFASDTTFADGDEPLFLLATEVSCIYSQGGKGRRIHILIWAPSIAVVNKINLELTRRGANLMSDGRPIIGLSSIDVAEIVLSIDPTCLIIPAHAWTPWFSLFGSESGFDSIEECFGPYAKYIYAIETGLSSDPAMNWRIRELDTRQIVSFSDAHSGPKLGREATIFDVEELSYKNIRRAIVESNTTLDDRNLKLELEVRGSKVEKNQSSNFQPQASKNSIAYTIEFYPEEGKYHYTGHRSCGVKHSPTDTAKLGTICPVCGKKLTVGVMHRVDQLAGRTVEELGIRNMELGKGKVRAISSSLFPKRPPYVMLVPLQEIIGECLHSMVTSQKVQNEYIKLVDAFGGEFPVLLNATEEDIAQVSGTAIATAITKVREGNIHVDPGYDGVFGVVKISAEEKKEEEEKKEQLSLF